MYIILAYFIILFVRHTLASPNNNLSCVPLVHYGKYSLNKHLCEEIGLKACKSNGTTFLSIDKNVIFDSPDPEICLNKLLSLAATLACTKSNGDGLIANFLEKNEITKESTIFISNSICQDIWENCTFRGKSEYSYLFKNSESVKFCNNLTSVDSSVKLSTCDIDQPYCLDRLVYIRTDEMAEINWLLGGGIDLTLLRNKIEALGILTTFCILSITIFILKKQKYMKKMTKKVKFEIVEFDMTLL